MPKNKNKQNTNANPTFFELIKAFLILVYSNLLALFYQQDNAQLTVDEVMKKNGLEDKEKKKKEKKKGTEKQKTKNSEKRDESKNKLDVSEKLIISDEKHEKHEKHEKYEKYEKPKNTSSTNSNQKHFKKKKKKKKIDNKPFEITAPVFGQLVISDSEKNKDIEKKEDKNKDFLTEMMNIFANNLDLVRLVLDYLNVKELVALKRVSKASKNFIDKNVCFFTDDLLGRYLDLNEITIKKILEYKIDRKYLLDLLSWIAYHHKGANSLAHLICYENNYKYLADKFNLQLLNSNNNNASDKTILNQLKPFLLNKNNKDAIHISFLYDLREVLIKIGIAKYQVVYVSLKPAYSLSSEIISPEKYRHDDFCYLTLDRMKSEDKYFSAFILPKHVLKLLHNEAQKYGISDPAVINKYTCAFHGGSQKLKIAISKKNCKAADYLLAALSEEAKEKIEQTNTSQQLEFKK